MAFPYVSLIYTVTLKPLETLHCTEVRFVSFLSGDFATMAVIDPPERKLAKCTSVHWLTLVTEKPGLSDMQSGLILDQNWFKFWLVEVVLFPWFGPSMMFDTYSSVICGLLIGALTF